MGNLEGVLSDVYLKFKLNFYRMVFKRFEAGEANLTTSETFCVEVIHALNRPTISEFSDFVKISQSNAAYKIQSLIKKGYVKKLQSVNDRREFRLLLTDKFHQYYSINRNYIKEVSKRVEKRFSKEEVEMFENMLNIINEELMNEIELEDVE